jgi:DNA replication protein DnaC
VQKRLDVETMRVRGESRKARKLLRVSRIPERYAPLDLSTYPDRQLATEVERWYLGHLGEVALGGDQDPFLLLTGPHRRGKTGLAIGVLKLAMTREIDCLFRTMTGLLDELAATFDKDNPACHADILAALKDLPLLLLDDLGANRLTEWRAETINSLLDHRSNENKRTVITTNLGWRNPAIYDPREMLDVCGERVFWRIRSSARALEVTGPVLGIGTDQRIPTERAP